MSVISEIGSNLLLFFLIFGMSATVDIENLRQQLRNRNAILTGILLQFIILPFLGFAVVKALGLDIAMGITLLVVTSSPGGSYSNWWCSMFNADLALSVTMTAISTLMSVIMLPTNLILYSRICYHADVVKNVDWVSLFIALGIVISAIGSGLYSSAKAKSPKFNLYANKLGSFAGLALIIYSIAISSNGNNEQSLWDRDWKFYLGVACPCVLGLAAANMISTSFGLKKPERVTVSVECCYQNTGIATSVAIAMFKGDDLSQAVGVPLYFGLVEAVVLGLYCIAAWKIGWTKAPADESFCVVIVKSYEVEIAQMHDINAIEVVLGCHKEGLPDDLIFELDQSLQSTASVDDDDHTNGSLYGISYPVYSKNQHIDKHTHDEAHQKSVKSAIAGSRVIDLVPEVILGPTKQELNTTQRVNPFNTFIDVGITKNINEGGLDQNTHLAPIQDVETGHVEESSNDSTKLLHTYQTSALDHRDELKVDDESMHTNSDNDQTMSDLSLDSGNNGTMETRPPIPKELSVDERNYLHPMASDDKNNEESENQYTDDIQDAI